MNKYKSNRIAKIQDNIREQKHSLVWVAESIKDGVQFIDPYDEGYPLLFVNSAFTNMTGYTNDEIAGKDQSYFEGVETNTIVSQKVMEMIKDKQSGTVELLNYRKDGGTFWKEMNINPLYNDEGELYAFMGIQKDITYKKETEDTRIASIFQEVQGVYSDYITFINLHGIISEMDEEMPGFKKIENENNVGKYFTDFFIETEKDKAEENFKRAIRGATGKTMIKSSDVNNDVFEVDLLYMPSFSNGKINGVYAIYRNITGYEKANKLLINANKFDLVKRISTSIAESMNLSLTALKGFVQLSSINDHLVPSYREVMLTEIERMEKTLNSLPYLLQPRLIDTEKHNLRTIIQDICTAMYSSTLKANIEINFAYHAEQEEIQIDKVGMEYVFVQLLKNSIDAMQYGGTICIEVKEYTCKELLIRVVDHGTGVSNEALKKMKQPFYTSKDDRLGLALTICDNIIIEHGGSLTFKKSRKRGMIIEIILPIHTN